MIEACARVSPDLWPTLCVNLWHKKSPDVGDITFEVVPKLKSQ
jgi:hypothetical protein